MQKRASFQASSGVPALVYPPIFRLLFLWCVSRVQMLVVPITTADQGHGKEGIPPISARTAKALEATWSMLIKECAGGLLSWQLQQTAQAVTGLSLLFQVACSLRRTSLCLWHSVHVWKASIAKQGLRTALQCPHHQIFFSCINLLIGYCWTFYVSLITSNTGIQMSKGLYRKWK